MNSLRVCPHMRSSQLRYIQYSGCSIPDIPVYSIVYAVQYTSYSVIQYTVVYAVYRLFRYIEYIFLLYFHIVSSIFSHCFFYIFTLFLLYFHIVSSIFYIVSSIFSYCFFYIFILFLDIIWLWALFFFVCLVVSFLGILPYLTVFKVVHIVWLYNQDIIFWTILNNVLTVVVNQRIYSYILWEQTAPPPLWS